MQIDHDMSSQEYRNVALLIPVTLLPHVWSLSTSYVEGFLFVFVHVNSIIWQPVLVRPNSSQRQKLLKQSSQST